MKLKYTVRIAVDGRVDVDVEAETPEEAFDKAKEAFLDADLARMEVVGAKPVNCTDEAGNLVDA